MTNSPGYPDRSPNLDALPGFKSPPPGYGEAPFWWWTGDDLDVDRMLWQVREVHSKGISGLQVNYAHKDSLGWPTDESGEPDLFTEEWWEVYSRVSEECGKLGMSIGLSTYTLDWPKGTLYTTETRGNLFHRLFYHKPELNAIELTARERVRVKAGGRYQVTVGCPASSVAPPRLEARAGAGPETGSRYFGKPKALVKTESDPEEACLAVHAYEVVNGVLQQGGLDLSELVQNGELSWTAPEGEWEVWTFEAVRREGTLNPLMKGAGETVVQGFYQPFEDRNPCQGSKGLNYFFNDELTIGLGKFAWNPDFADEFQKRKGYDLLDVLPAMWEEMGDITPKVRIDYADVRMSLMEERYFEPIYNWHVSRGIIFGCDNNGRGLEPHAYGDYYRAIRWYTAPGHDTPGGRADLIKGKVSSSIANLYQLPRVQLEGYHSLGWGATTERIMEATCENYLYGCNLFSLHGFYYTTYGSHWEWAPPCYHFRMPFWNHMGTFLKYFERLSYLMSQGRHVCDVAIIYPVTPYEAELDGDRARDAAFEVGRKLMAAGINFDFIDHQSLARAVVEDDRLVIRDAGASYRALVFPNMEAIRWESIDKAAAFTGVGGMALAIGALPSVSDRVGNNDSELTAINERAFKPECRLSTADEAVELIRNAFVQDVRGLNGTVMAQHRRIGPRDVYMVMGANPGDLVEFRAKGAAELWDPWTGEARPLPVVEETATGTQVELPLEKHEAQVVVFTPDRGQETGVRRQESGDRGLACERNLSENEWRVSFEPTMDNQFGDFRLPVTPDNEIIGVEARRFQWARETPDLAETAMLPDTDDSSWCTQLHGYGPKFYVLGPLPDFPSRTPVLLADETDTPTLDAKLAALDRIDPTTHIDLNGESFQWSLYDFSWRFGREGDPGHQGFHGLKGTISDNFIRLGAGPTRISTGITHEQDDDGRYYLWTSILLEEATDIEFHVSQPAPAGLNAGSVNTPAAVFIDGKPVDDLTQTLRLDAGRHTVLLRYEDGGENHLVLRRADVETPEQETPLAMSWFNDPGVIPFDPFAGEQPAEWFRFVSAPGTTAIHLNAESQGAVQAWINGDPMRNMCNGRFEVQEPTETAAVVALRLLPHPGQTGGAAIPEPITVETSRDGVMPLGDWSKQGILNNYSGGVRYRTTFTLTTDDAQGQVEIDLGRVIATAEVTVNGKPAGIRVAPPWKLDLSGLVAVGNNELEVLVYNTLANHYQTIPSQYRGDPESGLLGPVLLTVLPSS